MNPLPQPPPAASDPTETETETEWPSVSGWPAPFDCAEPDNSRCTCPACQWVEFHQMRYFVVRK
jgi:hypothetical protein